MNSCNLTRIGLLILLIVVPACKEKEKPAAEKEQTQPPRATPAASAPAPATQSSAAQSAKRIPPPTGSPVAASLPASRERKPIDTEPSSGSVSEDTPTTRRAKVSVVKGSTDRDGEVSLAELAESLAAAIDRAGRAFKGGDADAALAEAIGARRTLPSPAQVRALGAEIGASGESLAKQIEAMRAKLDQALERLEKAGAGDAPGSVMTQNLVIE